MRVENCNDANAQHKPAAWTACSRAPSCLVWHRASMPPPHVQVLKCRNRESGEIVAIKKFKSRIDGENMDAAEVRRCRCVTGNAWAAGCSAPSGCRLPVVAMRLRVQHAHRFANSDL